MKDFQPHDGCVVGWDWGPSVVLLFWNAALTERRLPAAQGLASCPSPGVSGPSVPALVSTNSVRRFNLQHGEQAQGDLTQAVT